nr:glycosyltransferase family 2 protein [Candidatus Kapabacteria bacterium]
ECVIGGTFFVKTEVALALKGFLRQYSEDSDFYERAVKNGYITEKTDFKTYKYYRDTADSICNKMKK